MKNLKKHWWLLLSLTLLAFWVRTLKLKTPLADWHSWRQADTASVTRQFVRHRYPIWEPHYHDLSNIPSGQENPNGYRMVEFPLINYLTAQLLIIDPQLDLVITSRLISIGFSLVGLISLYGLTYTLTRRRLLAFLSGFFFAVLPYSVFYSRVILPEPAMLGTQLLSLWLFAWWLDQKSKHVKSSRALYIASLLSLAISLLLKPTAVFIAPVYLVLSLSYLGWLALFSPSLWLYALGSVLPLIGWRHWIQNFPAGIPAAQWLLNGNGIRLRPAWWRWLFAERIGKLMLGYWGSAFLFLGLSARLRISYRLRHRFELVTLTWAASLFLYLVIFATGNVQHDYYQTLLIPLISLLLARGLFWIFTTTNHCLRRLIAWPLALLVLSLSLFFSYWQLKGFYQINNPAIVRAGQKLAELAPADATVIAPYGGDTAFLFQTERRGWPIGGKIEQRIEQGADYYVSVTTDDETQQLKEKYQVVAEDEEFVIIKLTPQTE